MDGIEVSNRGPAPFVNLDGLANLRKARSVKQRLAAVNTSKEAVKLDAI